MKKIAPGPAETGDEQASARPGIERRFGTRWHVPRLKAAALHFVLSMIAVGASAALLVTQWYPGALIHAAGGVKLLVMIALIDLILGPLLTFVVFDRRKKSLPFDLAFIVVLQVAALGYGLHASYQGRPLFTVFVVDRFELISAADIDAGELKLAPERYRTLSSSGPRLVAFEPPTGEREKMELAFAAASGVDAKYFLRYYVEYARLSRQVLAVSRPASELEQFNPAEQVRRELGKLRASGAPTELRYVPVQGRREDLSMIVDAADASVKALVRLRPWAD